MKGQQNLTESGQEIRTVDLTSMFEHNPSEKEARLFINSLLSQKGTYPTATEGWFITLNMRSKARSHIVHPREMTYGDRKEWDKDTKIRHNKAAMAIEQVLLNAVYDGQGAKKPKHPKNNVECYYNFLINLKFGEYTYRFIIDTEKYVSDIFTPKEKIVHMYNIHEDKNTPVVVEKYLISSKKVTSGVSNNSITDNDENFKPIVKNYETKNRSNSMKEDLTFFKDRKNKDGSKVKNPKRVFAGKMAHKKHGLSYKQADRASMVVEELKKYFLEAEIDQNNPVNLYALINLKNTTGGFQIQFDEDNYNNVDITLVSQDDSGVGAYQVETQGMDKSQASTMFQSLVNDLKTLADSIDKDFEAILKKNGITRRVQ